MDTAVYSRTQMELVEIGKRAQGLDLDGFIRQLSTAETTGPVLDPTLWLKAARNLRAIKKLAESVRDVKDVFTMLQNTIIETAIHRARTEGKDGLQ